MGKNRLEAFSDGVTAGIEPVRQAEHPAVPVPGLRQDQERALRARPSPKACASSRRDRRHRQQQGAPTFENTIVAMERSGQLLNRVSTTVFSTCGANTNDTLTPSTRNWRRSWPRTATRSA
jgi:hypothetical protein